MKECPNCGELNGDNNSRCYKCQTFLGAVSNTKKKCPKCGNIYNVTKDTCDQCGSHLLIFDENEYYSQKKNGSNTWMYICAFLIPLLGIILGCIKISNDKRDDAGKSLIIFSISVMVIYTLLIIMFTKCGAM